MVLIWCCMCGERRMDGWMRGRMTRRKLMLGTFISRSEIFDSQLEAFLEGGGLSIR